MDRRTSTTVIVAALLCATLPASRIVPMPSHRSHAASQPSRETGCGVER